MKEEKQMRRIPPVGMRIIKSAVGVALCFAIYLLRGQQGTPFYSALAVLWCIQSRIRDSLFNALQRVIGTAIGAVFGTVFILITLYINDFGYGPVHYLLLSAFIIPVIYLTVLIHEVNIKLYGRTRHYIRRVLFIWRKL